MSWQILNTEPAYAVCDQCKKHTCGIVDGEHKWIMTGIHDRTGDAIVIGYGCVHLWAANLGISRDIIVEERLRPPTEDEINTYLRNLIAMTTKKPNQIPPGLSNIDFNPLLPSTRDDMKAWLDERGISFAKNATDDKLRELVMQHAEN